MLKVKSVFNIPLLSCLNRHPWTDARGSQGEALRGGDKRCIIVQLVNVDSNPCRLALCMLAGLVSRSTVRNLDCRGSLPGHLTPHESLGETDLLRKVAGELLGRFKTSSGLFGASHRGWSYGWCICAKCQSGLSTVRMAGSEAVGV